MTPDPSKSKDSDSRKSKSPSNRVITGPENFQLAEETEIAAQISLPQEGGWGWVVVLCSFWCIFILDGIVFTFGSLLKDMTADLAAPESLVALLNSVAMALYFMSSPPASAFINRFGFRACAMTGAVLSSTALFCSYFATTIPMLSVTYGVIAGVGYSFINMSSILVVGFYFERLRSLALAISTTGSSVGIMLMFPVNIYLVSLVGWRITTLFHSGLFGLTFYLSMAYKPLLSLTVVRTADDATRTVTYLPSLVSVPRAAPSRMRGEGITSTRTERLLGAVSNIHFPTAAAVVEEGASPTATEAGPSSAAVSRLTLTAHNPRGVISQRQLEQVKTIMSRTSVQSKFKAIVEPLRVVQPKKRPCWARLCHWEKHVEESRPMYRDDAFYAGPVDKLTAYQKSVMETAPEARTGLEYQMAVSRAVTAADLKEKKGIFTTAARRVLVTMMDPILLSRLSFRLFCFSGFLMYIGLLVPYVFIQDRNLSVGIDATSCNLYVSVIGFSNIFGKIVIGGLALKVNPLKLYYWSSIVAGVATMTSNLSFSGYYQFAYAAVFGFSVASLACLRSLFIVDLYGLEKLTNATGMLLMFQGLGTLVSTPSASLLKIKFGYSVAFYVAGLCLLLSGVILYPVPAIIEKENEKQRKIVPENKSVNVPKSK